MKKIGILSFILIGFIFVFWTMFSEKTGSLLIKPNFGTVNSANELNSVGKLFRTLPVQAGGRIQPYDSFAQNTLRDIYGKTTFNGHLAVEVLLSWMLIPGYWDQLAFVQVQSASLKKALKLDLHKRFFSPLELLSNRDFIRELDELKVRESRKESLSGYFKHLSRLKNRLLVYQMFQKGEIPKWFPKPIKKNPTQYNSNWLSLAEQARAVKQVDSSLSNRKKQMAMYKAFQDMISLYVFFISKGVNDQSKGINDQSKGQPKGVDNQSKNEQLTNEQLKKKQQNLKFQVQHFKQLVLNADPSYSRLLSNIKWEVHYNSLNSFRWAWMFYLFGLVLLFLLFFIFRYFIQNFVQKKSALDLKNKLWSWKLSTIPLVFLIGGFLWHSYGIILRSIIMLRPPVTNMYETVIWIPWVSMVLGSFLWLQKNFFSAFVCSSVLACFCLLLTDFTDPSLLDGRLQPLSAVLNSNFWLATHVLVITMSYAAFFLAFVLGDGVLYLFFRGEPAHKVLIKKYIQAIDRSIQVGVVLLFVGTVLGGIWADYSWGRFWGWDPKETWALISLLGYLALLHGRLVGWIKDFGMAVGSVLIFFLIIMAWYGVNYVLGQGLHSYGFGSGGAEYVAGFVLVHLVYVVWVWTFRHRVTR